MTYRALGKQVLRNNEHFADAVDTTAAQIIADAMNGDRIRPYPHVDGPNEASVTVRPRFHHVSRRIGGYECTCGRRWDWDDGDETCPATTTS